MALGASPAAVLALVMRQGIALALAGIAIGLVASVAAVRALHTVLFEISPWDPWSGQLQRRRCSVSLPCILGARAAGAGVDPVVALRAYRLHQLQGRHRARLRRQQVPSKIARSISDSASRAATSSSSRA